MNLPDTEAENRASEARSEHDNSALPRSEVELHPFLAIANFGGHLRRQLGRLDVEQRMTFDRLVMNFAFLSYILVAASFGFADVKSMLFDVGFLFVAYNLASLALLAAALRKPGVAPLRRYLAIWLDVGMVSILAYMGGRSTAFLYPLILWTVFSNGLRFGRPYLVVAAGAAFVCFGAVVAATPFWRDNIELSSGLLAGLVLLPAYVSALTRPLGGTAEERGGMRAAESNTAPAPAVAAAASPVPAAAAGMPSVSAPVRPAPAAVTPSEAAVERRAAAAADAAVNQAAHASRRSLAILVAEDIRTNQNVIIKILNHAGHRVKLVADGKAALDALAVEQFDVVLMDLNMPGMNGLDATKLYRFAALGNYVPIVALTADATEQGAERCRAAGMDAYFFKPIQPGPLLAYLDSLPLDGTAPAPYGLPPAAENSADTVQDVEPSGDVSADATLAARDRDALTSSRSEVVDAIDAGEPGPDADESIEAVEAPALEAATPGTAPEIVEVAQDGVAPEPGVAVSAVAEPVRAEFDDNLGQISVIDMSALYDLEKLGGREFVDEIIEQFVSDATQVLKTLSQSVASASVTEFQEQAHALRSCAANVGARRVYELCLAWRELDARELAAEGEDHMRQLQAEFEATLAKLDEYRGSAGQAAEPPARTGAEPGDPRSEAA